MSQDKPELFEGMTSVPCAVMLDTDNPQFGWLFIPHADGKWVSAAKLEPFSMKIIQYWLNRPSSAEVEDKPVAAQEPVAWINKRATGGVEWNSKFDLPSGAPLYGHAAPCARCEELNCRIELLEIDMKSGDYETLYAQTVTEVEELQAKITEQAEQIKALEALSVTNILIGVVPGDGNGVEAYAKSVQEVVEVLTRLSEEAEERPSAADYVELRDKLAKADAVISRLQNIAKDVCNARYMTLDPLKTYTAEQKVDAEKKAAIVIADKISAAIEQYQKGE